MEAHPLLVPILVLEMVLAVIMVIVALNKAKREIDERRVMTTAPPFLS